MKRLTTYLRRPITLVLLAAAILGAGAAFAQTGGGYDLTWSTIDAGGGSSTGGDYQLAGTSGQADAGAALSGAGYSLSGGFWGGTTVENKLRLPLVRR